jgi:regulator of replication initiation timing
MSKPKTSEDPWKKIKELEKKVEELVEENASLWFLLDELEKSDINNENVAKSLQEAFSELRFASLLVHKKVEQA